MRELGEFLGFLIIVFSVLAISQYILKWFHKTFVSWFKKHPKFDKFYLKVMKFTIKYHKLFGFGAVLFLGAHFVIQIINIGPSLTGLVALAILLIQAGLGIYGNTKPKNKTWKIIHRILGFLLFLAILIHVL